MFLMNSIDSTNNQNIVTIERSELTLLYIIFPSVMYVCNFTNTDIAPWVFFTFLKLNKWYEIA